MIVHYFFIYMFLFFGLLSTSAAQGVSVHIPAVPVEVTQLHQPVWVKLQLRSQHIQPEQTQRLKNVLLTVHWQHPAQLRIALCDAQRKNCHQADSSGRLWGSFFTDQRLDQPLWLQVVAQSWQGGYPPVYARAELVLWPQPLK